MEARCLYKSTIPAKHRYDNSLQHLVLPPDLRPALPPALLQGPLRDLPLVQQSGPLQVL